MLPLMTFANEPMFCSYDFLKDSQVEINIEGLKREHVFQVGDLTLAGLAVGKSDIESTILMAEALSGVSQEENYCTYYFNKGNDEAETRFNHTYVSNPRFRGTSIANQYEERLGYLFTSEQPKTFLDCAINHNYIALGCNSQKHRGPSVFAMLLSFAGCHPEVSTDIANKLWKKNLVSKKTRRAIAEKGWMFGHYYPDLRKKLANTMLASEAAVPMRRAQ